MNVRSSDDTGPRQSTPSGRPMRLGHAPDFQWRDLRSGVRRAEIESDDIDPRIPSSSSLRHDAQDTHELAGPSDGAPGHVTHEAAGGEWTPPGERVIDMRDTLPSSDARTKDAQRRHEADPRNLPGDAAFADDAGPRADRVAAVDQVVVADPAFGLEVARRRFGGLDIGASLAGMLAALGMTALFGGIFAAIGSYGYQLDVERDAQTLTIGGLAAGLAVLFLSFLVGGWVAGRIARYAGGRNGLWAATWFLVLGLLLSAAGAAWGPEYNVLNNLQVPRWFSDNWTASTFVNAAAVSALLAIVLMLVAGFLGGVNGGRYHRKVDEVLVHTGSQEIVTGTSTRPTVTRSDPAAPFATRS